MIKMIFITVLYEVVFFFQHAVLRQGELWLWHLSCHQKPGALQQEGQTVNCSLGFLQKVCGNTEITDYIQHIFLSAAGSFSTGCVMDRIINTTTRKCLALKCQIWKKSISFWKNDALSPEGLFSEGLYWTFWSGPVTTAGCGCSWVHWAPAENTSRHPECFPLLESHTLWRQRGVQECEATPASHNLTIMSELALNRRRMSSPHKTKFYLQ